MDADIMLLWNFIIDTNDALNDLAYHACALT